MNKQNFTSSDRFPLSTEALSFMQEMIGAAAGLARIGGENYILSGCTKSGSNVAPGVIVVNGEVMPFEGGVAVPTIVVVETPKSISANGLTFKDARVERYAKFATGTGANYLPWAKFQPLQTNGQLEKAKATVTYVDEEIKKIQSGSIPAGVIVMWSGAENKIPSGWALCNGMVPAGGEKPTPDLLGRFIVGYNPTKGSGYTSIGAGEKGADQYNITLSPDNMPAHNHKNGTGASSNNSKTEIYGTTGEDAPGSADVIAELGDHKPNIQGYTSTAGQSIPFDARPPYYVLAYIIKL